MANPAIKIDVDMNMKPGDTAVSRAMKIIDWYLADNPDKTIVIEREGDLRVCLIANVDGSPV